MRVEIYVCVANDSDAHEWLDRILHKISDGWHLWDTTRISLLLRPRHGLDKEEIEATVPRTRLGVLQSSSPMVHN